MGVPGAGAGTARVFGGGGNARSGRTTVLRESPVAGSMSSSCGGRSG